MPSPLTTFLLTYHRFSGEEEQIITDAFEPRSYKEGETLFAPNRVCKEMFFVCAGVLRIVGQNEKGMDVTWYFLKEDRLCSILNSFNNGIVSHESIEAACDAEVLAISKDGLLRLYTQIPYLKELIDKITMQALLDKLQIRNTYLGKDSTARYKLFLEQQPGIATRVSQQDIASYLEITPQSLSRIRRSMA